MYNLGKPKLEHVHYIDCSEVCFDHDTKEASVTGNELHHYVLKKSNLSGRCRVSVESQMAHDHTILCVDHNETHEIFKLFKLFKSSQSFPKTSTLKLTTLSQLISLLSCQPFSLDFDSNFHSSPIHYLHSQRLHFYTQPHHFQFGFYFHD